MDRLWKSHECQEDLLHRLSACVARIALDLKIIIEWASFAQAVIVNETSSSPHQYRGCCEEENQRQSVSPMGDK